MRVSDDMRKGIPLSEGAPRDPAYDYGSAPSIAVEPGLPEEPEIRQIQYPFDPVLRMALIDKGILTPEDLQAAEAKIRTVSGLVNGGGNGLSNAGAHTAGQQSDSTDTGSG